MYYQPHTQVTLSRYNSITVRTVKFGHVLRVLLQNVHLHGTTLSEASMADVTFIWLLSFSSRRKKRIAQVLLLKRNLITKPQTKQPPRNLQQTTIVHRNSNSTKTSVMPLSLEVYSSSMHLSSKSLTLNYHLYSEKCMEDLHTGC